MSHAKRFKKRKKISVITNEGENHDHLVEKHLMAQVDTKSVSVIDEAVESAHSFKFKADITENESTESLRTIEKEFKQEQFESLIEACRGNVISAIVIPFGIGRVIAEYDKKGGNVTTFHNAQDGVYAHESQEYDRGTYTKRFKGKSGAGNQFTKDQLYDGNKVVDAYTGKEEIGSGTSPDHIVSLSKYHTGGGFIQTDELKSDFGADSDNYAITRRNINQSL